MAVRQATICRVTYVAAGVCLAGLVASVASAAPQRLLDVYQESAREFCDPGGTGACTVAFSVLEKPLKILNVSCTILTSEGGSPSKEITGVSLGRASEDRGKYIAGPFLAPLQSEFAGVGQVVLNLHVNTLFVVPGRFRPAIQVSRLNGPPVSASCTIAGEN